MSVAAASRRMKYSNLEAAPLVVQLVQEGKKWRLQLALPLVGLAGSSVSSSRYMDYAPSYFGQSIIRDRTKMTPEHIAELEGRRRKTDYLQEHFEHPSTANGYFARIGISGLVKDLNLLQLRLQKQKLSLEAVAQLLEKQLKKVYWDGLSLFPNDRYVNSWFGENKWKKKLGYRLLLAPRLKKTVEAHQQKLEQKLPVPRDYSNLLRELYRFPPMHNFDRTCYKGFGCWKNWPFDWGCEALGVLGVDRAQVYSKSEKRWYPLEYTFKAVGYSFAPEFYRHSYQRYKENGAICSGYPDYFFCTTDARDEWRKAVDWFPDSVARKENGPLKKPLYVGHRAGALPPPEMGQQELQVHPEALAEGFDPDFGEGGWSGWWSGLRGKRDDSSGKDGAI